MSAQATDENTPTITTTSVTGPANSSARPRGPCGLGLESRRDSAPPSRCRIVTPLSGRSTERISSRRLEACLQHRPPPPTKNPLNRLANRYQIRVPGPRRAPQVAKPQFAEYSRPTVKAGSGSTAAGGIRIDRSRWRPEPVGNRSVVRVTATAFSACSVRRQPRAPYTRWRGSIHTHGWASHFQIAHRWRSAAPLAVARASDVHG
jgi:hypothetical protein